MAQLLPYFSAFKGLKMIKTLLIIEDEKLLGYELSRHYKQLGWEVVLAITLKEARELLISKN